MSEFRIQPAYGKTFDRMDVARATNAANSLSASARLESDGSIVVTHAGIADSSWQIRARLSGAFSSVSESRKSSHHSSSSAEDSTEVSQKFTSIKKTLLGKRKIHRKLRLKKIIRKK